MRELAIPGKVLVYTILILLSIVFIIPFIWMLRSSLMELAQIFALPPIWIPDPLKFGNYKEALTILPFGKYFVNTIVIVSLSMVGTIFTCTIAAFSFSRIHWKGRDKVFGVILSTMMLPYIVTVIPSFIGWRAVGLTNSFGPLTIPAFFGLGIGGPLFIFLLRQFYMTIPLELDEAAFVDGASYFKIYYKIILPLSKPAVTSVALFTFMNYWNDFFGPLIFLNDEKKFTLALGLQQFNGMYNANWHLLMAASSVIVAPMVVVFLIGQKYFIEGITMTGLKG